MATGADHFKRALATYEVHLWSIKVKVAKQNQTCVDTMGWFVFIFSTISPCTTGLKALFSPSDWISTVQLSNF